MAAYYVVARMDADDEDEVRGYFDGLMKVDGYFYIDPGEVFEVHVTESSGKQVVYDQDGIVKIT